METSSFFSSFNLFKIHPAVHTHTCVGLVSDKEALLLPLAFFEEVVLAGSLWELISELLNGVCSTVEFFMAGKCVWTPSASKNPVSLHASHSIPGLEQPTAPMSFQPYQSA